MSTGIKRVSGNKNMKSLRLKLRFRLRLKQLT